MQNPPPYGARAEAMAAAAGELNVTSNYLYRLLKAYEADPRTRSLLLKTPGPAGGVQRLDHRVEAIIEEEIRGNYLTLLRPKKSLLMKGIQARCAAKGLAKPARQTVDARLAAISKREQTKRRHGSKKARDEFNPIRGSLEVERPLEVVQIDHTPADLQAVEPDSLEVIGRPFITLAVDIRTRMSISERMDLCGETVRHWLKRFKARGFDGLEEDVRSGRPPTYTAAERSAVIDTALPPPAELGLPFASWTLDRLVAHLSEKGIGMKRSRAAEIFVQEGLKWRQEETWFGARVDPDFAKKRGRLSSSTPRRQRAA